MNPDLVRRWIEPSDTNIVMLVVDGLGGLPPAGDGRTELEAAATPNRFIRMVKELRSLLLLEGEDLSAAGRIASGSSLRGRVRSGRSVCAFQQLI
jgi:hypothetical protein